MTICIAALCQWNQGSKENPDWAAAIVTAADRMFTDTGLEIQYEGGQGKWASFGKRVIMLVADSLPIQSEIIRQLHQSCVERDDITAREVADRYSELVVKFKRDEAEKLYLWPLGMTMNAFAEQIQTNTGSLMNDLARELIDHSIAVEAIVAGVTEQGDSSIYHINNSGIITSHIDVGFVSIGSGHSHANAFLMSRGYWNRWSFYNAVCAIYAAKTQAENAPGVGKTTDVHLITRDAGLLPVTQEMRDAINAEYPVYKKQLARLEARMIEKIWKRTNRAIEKAQAAALPSEVTGDQVVITLKKK